jgi:hypothetical protein
MSAIGGAWVGIAWHSTFQEPIHSRAHYVEESEESAGQLGVAVDACRNRQKGAWARPAEFVGLA